MSIGIYKFTNKHNGMSYIGQSVELEQRYTHHIRFYHKDSKIDQAINELGIENFTYEILELCDKEELDEKEKFYIKKYNSLAPNGYNQTIGGFCQSGSCTIDSLSDDDIRLIRTYYRDQVYSSAAELQRTHFPHIDRHIIAKIYNGQERLDIMPEVYSQLYFFDNKSSYQDGEKNASATLTDYEAMVIRVLYTCKQRKEIFELFPEKNPRTITSIISGQNWKHIPIYKKREKRWIYPNS